MGQLVVTAVGKSVFSKSPIFSEIGRILTLIGQIPVPRIRRFQRQNYHHKRDSRSFDPPTHPGYPDADLSLGSSFSYSSLQKCLPIKSKKELVRAAFSISFSGPF